MHSSSKLFFELINPVCNNRLGHFFAKKYAVFDSIFVMYPAGQGFADHFTFRFRQWMIRWRPFAVNVIKHPSGSRMLVVAISSFIDKKEQAPDPEMLRLLHARALLLKNALGAKTLHFAGTLPGRFTTQLRINRGDDQKNERIATQKNVVTAILRMRVRLGHDASSPVVILGSRGYIGKTVTAQLAALSIIVIGIDKDTSSTYQKPDGHHLLVNITEPEAINNYLEHMDEKTALLNEVYPAPHRDVVVQMKERGARVFHIAGVLAETLFSFPYVYQGAIPCCAALPDEEYEVKIIEL